MASAGVMKMWPCGACSGRGRLGGGTALCPRCNGTGDALRYRDGPLARARRERIERIALGMEFRIGPVKGDGL